ncbi:MAG: GspE/PulE family protein [Pirellulales bacterium]
MNSILANNSKEIVERINLDLVGIDPKWALRVPRQFAIRKNVLPLSLIGSEVQVACSSREDLSTRQAVENYLQRTVHFVLADPVSLTRALDRVYQRLTLGDLDDTLEVIASNSQDDPVKVCNTLIQAAVLRGASDIHLVPGEQWLSVQLRVDGQLEFYDQINKQLQAGVTSRLKVLSGMDIAEKRAAQDGRITAFLGESGRKRNTSRLCRLRYGERMTLRLLANTAVAASLKSLGMNELDLSVFRTAAAKPHGLILLTGPTGSGKSTTLYAAIDHILKTQGGNVITIEDPVEYEISGASQVEVDSVDKVNFTKALRSVLRHDPDVLMIGEIRDAETADTAIKAALTGHLVFSTLHTNTSTGVVTRLIDMGVEPYLVAATLRLSVAQRLVRRLCPHCRVARPIRDNEALLLGTPELESQTTYDPVGCLNCAGKGYIGRVGLFEMFQNDSQFAKLIANLACESQLATTAQQKGLRSLLEDGVTKVLDGTTTVSEIVSAIAMD